MKIRAVKQMTDSLRLPTYQAGLMQAKAYRALKNHTAGFLAKHDLSTPEWALLGYIYSRKNGLRLSQISEILGVEAPLATNLVTALEQKKLVIRHRDDHDSRAKIVKSTVLADRLVPQIEKELRSAMRQFLKGVSLTDLATYLKVLEVIASKI